MLSVSRLCSKTLTRQFTKNISLITQRNFHNVVKKQINNIPGILKYPINNTGKLLGCLKNSGTIAFKHSVVDKTTNKVVGSWLLICGGMVFVAVALGGVTRLTESGLSMVTWKLLGEKMPVSNSQWIEEFEKYKQYPEYKIMNKEMTLEEFKKIWWMEYAHRMWGRLIGIVYAAPALYFWYNGMLKKEMKIRVLILGCLIGAQGLMGWYMVKSGLEDRFQGPNDIPRVSQYRLAAHLGLALTLYTGFLYNALGYLIPSKQLPLDWFNKTNINHDLLNGLVKFKRMIYCTKGLVLLTALSGAFVAGLDAGLIYNSFPLMADKFIPDDILAFSPVLKNFTENPTTVQFDHRILGISTLTLITLMAWKSRGLALPGRGSKAMAALCCAAYFQVVLGITTLLTYVPVHLAATHQCGSMIVLGAATWLCHELKYIRKIPK